MIVHANENRGVKMRDAHSLQANAGGGLFLWFLDFLGFDILGFEDLSAIQTLDVVDAASSGDDLSTGMLAGRGLHKQRSMRFILTVRKGLSSPNGGSGT